MPGRATTLQIPRWIQLVGLPILLLLAWTVAGAVRHVVFLFLVAAMIALVLNPLVRGISRFWIPRGFAVAVVYLAFAAAMITVIVALATVVVNQTRSASNRVNDYFTVEHGQTQRAPLPNTNGGLRTVRQTDAERDIDRLQHWLDTHRLTKVKIRKQARDFVNNIKAKDVEKYTTRVIDFVQGAALGLAQLLFSVVLVVVISIYMLLDMPRLARSVDRRFPPAPDSPPLLARMEAALVGYLKGQALLSLIMGTSAGLGLWLLGTLGWVPGVDRYALLFGCWVAVTELIPYLGPWLGAVPPFLYALVIHPVSAVWVAVLFLIIHQVEGHIVVPNVMGSALRLHPLLVIFGLLAGAEIYGLPGALSALPLLAAARAMWEFFGDRVSLEPWTEGGVVPVEVQVEAGPRPVPATPSDPPAAARR